MPGAHPDPIHLQGSYGRGDARVGSCYGRRTAAEYNRVKAQAKEMRTGKPVVLRYFARKLLNDNFIREFVVINGRVDPTMFVMSENPDSTFRVHDPGRPEGYVEYVGWERWFQTEEDGRLVFLAPPGYAGGPISWVHDRRFFEQHESSVYESTKSFIELGASS